jgi:histidinol-phosphate aminotransferase
MQSALAAANFYPDDDCAKLRRKLAAYHAVPMEQVLVTVGSTGMLALLCQTMLAPGLNAVTSERSFIIYGMAVRATGAQLIQAPMRKDKDKDQNKNGFDLAAILHAINDDTRIIFLANPNNPTGTMLEAWEVDQFLAEVPPMWWWSWTKHTTTLPCTSPPCVRLSIRGLWNTFDGAPA